MKWGTKEERSGWTLKTITTCQWTTEGAFEMRWGGEYRGGGGGPVQYTWLPITWAEMVENKGELKVNQLAGNVQL